MMSSGAFIVYNLIEFAIQLDNVSEWYPVDGQFLSGRARGGSSVRSRTCCEDLRQKVTRVALTQRQSSQISKRWGT